MQSPMYVGVDVAKAEVVVACSQNSFAVRGIPNTPSALKQFLQTLPSDARIGMEATGSYHFALADLAFSMGFAVYVLNPQDTWHYAKGVGSRAKTDRVDAKLIARYTANESAHLHPYDPATAEQRAIDQLLRRRSHIVSLKTAMRLSCADAPFLNDQAGKLMADFKDLLKQIDQEVSRVNALIPNRSEQVKQLQTITGIGPLTSSWLANLFDRVKFKNGDAVVAFVGMDPRPCDSGQKRGRRRLSKRGPAEGRRLLYNAAMAAAKSPVWQPMYARYRQLGWPTTAALLIIARKILRIAFALSKKQGAVFDPKILGIGA